MVQTIWREITGCSTNDELEMICKKTNVAHFKKLYRHLLGETEENYDRTQSGQTSSGSRYEPSTCQITSGSVNPYAATVSQPCLRRKYAKHAERKGFDGNKPKSK